MIPHLSYASVELLLLEASELSPVRKVAEAFGEKLTSALACVGVGGGTADWKAVKEAGAKLAGKSSRKGAYTGGGWMGGMSAAVQVNA